MPTRYITAKVMGNSCTFFFKNQVKIPASKTIKEFGDILPEYIFFRVHLSHLINLNYNKNYYKCDGGQIELQNGIFADVTGRKKEDFLKTIGQ